MRGIKKGQYLEEGNMVACLHMLEVGGGDMQWLASHKTDPKTNTEITSQTLIPNHGLRATIGEFLANHQ
jgi:hypothetical protein